MAAVLGFLLGDCALTVRSRDVRLKVYLTWAADLFFGAGLVQKRSEISVSPFRPQPVRVLFVDFASGLFYRNGN